VADEVVPEEPRALDHRQARRVALQQEAVRRREAAREHDHERERQVGDRLRVLPRRGHDREPALGRSVDVDVDRPAARTADEAERPRREHLVRHGRRVNHEHLGAVDRLDELVRAAHVLADRVRRRGGALLVELHVVELVRPVEPRESLPEDLDRHVRVADDEDLHYG
jgi:hypothetical protein